MGDDCNDLRLVATVGFADSLSPMVGDLSIRKFDGSRKGRAVLPGLPLPSMDAYYVVVMWASDA